METGVLIKARPAVPAAEQRDRLRLARTEGVGPVLYQHLMSRFGNAGAALEALPALARNGGRLAAPIVPPVEAAEAELASLAKLGATVMFAGTPPYPPLLALLDDPPPVIAVLGEPALLTRPSIAVVGGRNASAAGIAFTATLAAELAEAGVIVVSGLARGIDSAAHIGALSRGGTIAVVAGGVDVAYPPENAALQRRIAEGGAVVAECKPGTVPQARHFPRRNRIIAGLTLGTVVVEAALKSGSLITARLAEEASRLLFAVPGSPLDPRCLGSNHLIRSGAILTESAADVLDAMPESFPAAARAPQDTGFAEPSPAEAWDGGAPDAAEARADLLARLGPTPVSVDTLLRHGRFPAPLVQMALMELDLAGRIEHLPGQRVARLG